MIRIGMGQILVESEQEQANLRRAVEMVGRAAERGCQVVVLPECLDLGWLAECVRERAQEIPGERSDVLAAAAKRHGVYVAAGLTEREGDRIYNCAVFIGPDGRILLKHRKINELRFGPEHDVYAAGDRLGVVQTELGCIGLNICADNWCTSLALGHAQARMGAQLIVSPCAWAVPADFDNAKTPYGKEWSDAYGELARLYDMGIVGVSNVGPLTSGPWKGWRCIGNSLAVGPDGAVLVWGKHGIDAEELVVVEMELVPRTASGTALLGRLRQRGYAGG